MNHKNNGLALNPDDYVNANFHDVAHGTSLLCRRLLVPNNPEEIRWVEEHKIHFNDVGVNWGKSARLWHPDGPISDLPIVSYALNNQLYAVYKTSKNIVSKCAGDHQKSSSLTALLSHIVWSCRSRKCNPETLYNHTKAIRRSLVWLLDHNQVPSVSKWQKGNTWLNAAIAILNLNETNESLSNVEQRHKDLTLLLKILDGTIKYGEKQRSIKISKADTEAICRIDMASEHAYTREFFFDKHDGSIKTNWVQISPKKVNSSVDLDEDDCNPTERPIEIQLESSALPYRDAKFAAEYIAEAIQLKKVQGVFNKATDSTDIAALKLSLFAPQSIEGRTMVLMITLGRLSLLPNSITTINKNVLAVPSIHDESQSVEIALPPSWDIPAILEHHKLIRDRIKNAIKKSGHIASWSSRAEGLARFGAFKFHSKLGAVIAAQLQGRDTDVNVTAGYSQLSNEDYQNGFNTVFQEVMNWLSREAKYVGDDWKTWASLQIKAPHPNSVSITYFGSNKVIRIDAPTKKSIEQELRGKFKEASLLWALKPISEYLTSCTLALHVAFQLATGARPVSSMMKLTIVGDVATLSDKAWGNIHPARMIKIPLELAKALVIHKRNVLSFVYQNSSNSNADITPLVHPFFTVAFDEKFTLTVNALSNGQVAAWMGRHFGKRDVKANGLRHAMITDLQHYEHHDGVLTRLVGHERRGASICSRYLSSPAVITPPSIIDPWIPKIRSINYV